MSKQERVRWRLEERNLDDLIDFPLQDLAFPRTSKKDDDILLQDLRKNGLKHHIEVLPENDADFEPNTILAGHRRSRLLRRIGKTTCKVKVMYSLAHADRATIVKYFLGDNDHRRQLAELDKARLALRRFELELGVEPGDLSDLQRTEARERIAKALSCTRRNASRYFAALSTPFAVQMALGEKKVKLEDAARVAGLPDDIKERIAARIAKGESPARVVACYLGSAQSVRSRGAAVSQFIGLIAKANACLAGYSLADFRSCDKGGEVKELRLCRKTIGQLIGRLQESRAIRGAAMKEGKLTARRTEE